MSADTADKSTPVQRGMVRVAETGDGKFANAIDAGGHRLAAGEPVDAGGDDRGPAPYELLLAALGACTSITLRMYADRKGWPLEHVSVELRHEKIHADDCAHCDTEKGYLDRIHIEVNVEGPLDEEQRARLLDIAHRCPVHRTLQNEVDMPTTLQE